MPPRRLFALLVSALALPVIAQTPTFDLRVNIFGGQATAGTVNFVQMSVTNHGPSSSTGFTVNINVAGATFQSASMNDGTPCTHSPSSVQCSVNQLLTGQTIGINLGVSVPLSATSFTIDAEAAVDDANQANNRGSGTWEVTSTKPTSDVEITAVPPLTQVVHGQNATLIFRVTNHGPETVTSLPVASSAVPDFEVRDVTLATGAGSCADVPMVQCTIASLASGSSADILVELRANVPGLHTIDAGADPRFMNSIDPAPGNNSATAVVEVVTQLPPRSSDLAVTLQAAAASVPLATTTTFVATIRNLGPDAAELASVTAVLASNFQLIAATSAGANCTRSGNEALCVLPPIPSGSTATMTLTAVARGAGAATATATTSLSTDPNAGNNTAQVTITVIGGRSRPVRRF